MARRPFGEEGGERAIGLLLAEDDLQRDVLIARRARYRRDAAPLEAEHGAAIGALGHRHADRPADRRYADLAAEHRLGEGHRQFDMDVVALAAEQLVRRDMHLDQRVARRAAAQPGVALALETQDLAVGEAGGDGHVETVAGGESHALLGAARRLEEIDGQGEGAIGAAQPDRLPTARPAAATRLPAEEIGEDVAELVLGDAALLMV